MKLWKTALVTVAVISSGCRGSVLDPVQGEGTGGSGGSVGSTGYGSAPSALATFYGKLPPSVDLQAQGTPDPDSLVLFFASESQSCTDLGSFSFGLSTMGCAGEVPFWQTAIILPPNLDAPGVIDLADPPIQEAAAELFPGCSGGGERGGTAGFGTLDIVSEDPTSISVTLSGGVTAMTTVIDGAYLAAVCPEI